MRAVAVCGDVDSDPDLVVKAIRDAGFSCMRVSSIGSWCDANPFGIAVLVFASDIAGLDTVRQIKSDHSGVSPVCLITEPTTQDVVAAFNAGAEGVLDARVPAHLIVQTLQTVDEGMALVDVALMRSLMEFYPETPSESIDTEDLTLLRLIVEGAKPYEIARELHCSRRTAYRRIRELCNKIGVQDRNEAIYLAGRWALLERYW